MKKIVCLHNVYFEGRFLSAGTDAALPDDVACNWVERGLAKFVGEETPVNPPAVPSVEKPDSPGVVKPAENEVTVENPVNENSDITDNLTTEKTAVEETPVTVDDVPKRGRPPKKKHGGKRR